MTLQREAGCAPGKKKQAPDRCEAQHKKNKTPLSNSNSKLQLHFCPEQAQVLYSKTRTQKSITVQTKSRLQNSPCYTICYSLTPNLNIFASPFAHTTRPCSCSNAALYPAKISAKHIHRQSKYNPSLIESSSRVQPESSSQYQQRHTPYNQFQWHCRTIPSEQCDLE